jgi:hypothetical protein
MSGLVATDQLGRALSLALAHLGNASPEGLFALLEALLDHGDLADAKVVVDALGARGEELTHDPRLARARERLSAR